MEKKAAVVAVLKNKPTKEWENGPPKNCFFLLSIRVVALLRGFCPLRNIDHEILPGGKCVHVLVFERYRRIAMDSLICFFFKEYSR
jgi:hypothetical protein